MNKENQKFYGTLTDKELYLIECALANLGKEATKEKQCGNLVKKLYSDFAELPKSHKIITQAID